MIVIVDERELVLSGFSSQFRNIGFPGAGFNAEKFASWIEIASTEETDSIAACLVSSDVIDRFSVSDLKAQINAPVIALLDQASLETTLKLFAEGVDDVIRKPVNVREILARISAIDRRAETKEKKFQLDRLSVHFDGRDPEVDGKVFPLPRRERRILEYLASIGSRRANKSQIFNAIYGVFNEDVEEKVVESHISKLRKKLRLKLGYDPIDSRRYLGYRLMRQRPESAVGTDQAALIGLPA